MSLKLLELMRSFKKGDHISYINYESTKSVKYFAAFIAVGIERNEQCIYLAYDTSIADVSKCLTELDINVEACLERGQLIFRTATEFYFGANGFSQDYVIKEWEKMLAQAKKKGYSGLRAIGETGWITNTELFNQVMTYEKIVEENMAASSEFTALCQYRVNGCSDEMIKEILGNHNYTFYDNGSSVSLFQSRELLRSDTIRFLHESIRDKTRLNKTCRHLTVSNGLTAQTLYRNGPKYMAEKAVEYLGREHGAQIAVSVFIDKETNRVRYTSCYGVDLDSVVSHIAGPTIQSLIDYAGRIYPYMSPDVGKEPLRELWRQNNIKHLAIIPLQNGHHIVGLTFVGWRDPMEANAADLELLTYFLSTINMALDVHYMRDKTYKKKKDAEKLEALGTLISGIAHEFNNILAVILGNCQLLQLKCKEEGLVKYISDATKAAQDAANIVRRIQNYSRPKVTYERTNVSINSLVNSAVEFTRPKWNNESVAAGIQVEVDCRLNSTKMVYANEGELREVFINLILNAVDALPRGGRICISTADCNDRVIVNISDNGIGMTSEEVERAFDPFYTTKYDRGTGLGLTITRNMVLAHNGEICVESEKGKGTIFIIKLPEGSASVVREGQVSYLPGRALRINVVDDDKQVLDSVCSQLVTMGHEVQAFTNASELLACVDNGGAADLVITDLAMPGINGISLANKLREKKNNLPVILMTGWFDGTRNFLEKGAIAGILYKPFTVYDLQKQIEEIRGLVS